MLGLIAAVSSSWLSRIELGYAEQRIPRRWIAVVGAEDFVEAKGDWIPSGLSRWFSTRR